MKYPEFLTPFVFPRGIPLLSFIRWYGLMYIIGILLSCVILYYVNKKGYIKYNEDSKGNGGINDMVFYAAIGAIIGGRIGYFLFYSPYTFLTPWEIFGFYFNNRIQFIGFSGMSFHGGFVGMVISLYLFSKKFNYKFYDIADHITLPASVALFFGRIGNFMNSELYGRVTNSFIAIKFPLYDSVGGYDAWLQMFPAIRPYTVPRHPSQLYEAFLEGIVLASVSYIIMILAHKNKNIRPGTRLWVWVILYGLFRVLIEQFAREVTEWNIGIITSGSIYSSFMIILGTIMLIHIYKKKF